MELPDRLEFFRLPPGSSADQPIHAGGVSSTPEADSASWRVRIDSVIDPADSRIPLLRHGLSVDSARRIAARATVLSGRYPRVDDVTGAPEAIENLLGQVSEAGALFTVFASLYGNECRSVLLLDYLR